MPHQHPDEIFDVVDERDRVVGRATRAVVHRDGLRHRAAHVFVLNSLGELFVQRRALTKDESPGLWDSSAAGHLDAGETYAAAARRELAEELGVDLPPERFVEVVTLPADPATGHEFRRLFVVETDVPPRPDPAEVLDGRFLPLDELDRRLADGSLPVTGAFLAFYARYRAWAGSSRSGPASDGGSSSRPEEPSTPPGPATSS